MSVFLGKNVTWIGKEKFLLESPCQMSVLFFKGVTEYAQGSPLLKSLLSPSINRHLIYTSLCFDWQ